MMDRELVFELGTAEVIPRHLHSGLEIIQPLKGTVEYEADGRTFHLERDDIIVCNSGQAHSLRGCGANIVFRVFVHDSFVERESGFSSVELNCNSALEATGKTLAYDELRRVLSQLLLAHYNPDPFRNLGEKTALFKTLSYLFTHFQEKSRPAQMDADSRIRTVKRYLAVHYKSEVSLADAASQAHISPHYLSRLFKKEEGTGFYEYLKQLRLGGALADLLHTRDSILKVALSNGFSNVASFNRSFFKVYGQNPARYRARRQVEKGGDRLKELSGALEGGGDLVKFLRNYDLKAPPDSRRTQDFSIHLAEGERREFTAPARVVRVGRICELLKSEVRRQIQTLLDDDVRISSAHVRVLYRDGMYPYKSAVYADYEYFQALDFLVASKLSPILEFSLEDGESPQEALTRLEVFLKNMRERYGAAELRSWRLEISGYQNLSVTEVTDFCEGFSKILGRTAPEIACGLQFIDDGALPVAMTDEFVKILRMLSPQFISYYLRHDPALALAKDSDFGQLRHYCAKRLAQFVAQLAPVAPDIFLMEWNTLSGFKALESNTFYRSALFMDEILHLCGTASGVAVWLNNYVYEAATGRESFDAPAFFLFDILKRPVYFALKLLDMLRGQSVVNAESLAVTRDGDSDYTLLIYNPSYFNPEYASDKSFAESQSRLFTLRLIGLSGEYIFERRHMDQGQSALYDRWASMGFPPMLDQKVITQLDKAVNMGYSIFEESLEGEYKIQFTLGFNEAVLFYIRKKA